MNDYPSNPDDFDADADDLSPIDETEFEESDGMETALEVEQLLARVQAAIRRSIFPAPVSGESPVDGVAATEDKAGDGGHRA